MISNATLNLHTWLPNFEDNACSLCAVSICSATLKGYYLLITPNREKAFDMKSAYSCRPK